MAPLTSPVSVERGQLARKLTSLWGGAAGAPAPKKRRIGRRREVERKAVTTGRQSRGEKGGDGGGGLGETEEEEEVGIEARKQDPKAERSCEGREDRRKVQTRWYYSFRS